MLTHEQAEELHQLINDTRRYLRGEMPGRVPSQMDDDLTRALELTTLLVTGGAT